MKKKMNDMSEMMPSHDAKWDAESLMKAEEIRGDKGRHEAAMKHLHKQKKMIKSLSDLKKARNDLFMSKNEDSDD